MKKESKRSCSEEVCLRPLGGIMEIISRRWALLIISVIGNRKLRYNKIIEKLSGISPKSLSDRIKELEKAGLIKRDAYAEIPPRVEYSLTKDGEELRRAIIPLMEWVSQRQSQHL